MSLESPRVVSVKELTLNIVYGKLYGVFLIIILTFLELSHLFSVIDPLEFTWNSSLVVDYFVIQINN